MSRFDWDMDELLNFDYGKPVPDGRSTAESHQTQSRGQQHSSSVEQGRRDDAQLYAEIRRKKEEQAIKEAQLRAQQEAQQKAELRARIEARLRAQQEEEIDLRSKQQEAQNKIETQGQQTSYGNAMSEKAHSDEMRAAAQKAAYERYRAQNRNEKTGNQDKNITTKTAKAERKFGKDGSDKSSKFAKKSKGAKILSALYMIATVVFAVAMLIMNVLPMKYLIMLYVVLGLLALIVVVQLTGARVKKWARKIAVFMAVVLTIVYGVGTAYAFGTLSFLGTTSVENQDSVGKITEDPFNVVMTGIDVSGTIDEQGRSDVNMIVTVNPQTSTILMTSIPRDYEVRLPDKGYATDKLTHTGFYGVETTILAEEDLFAIESNYYVKVNFSTVRNFINAIGGIDVYSEYTFNPVKMKSWTVQEGMNHMNGEQALAFARERKAFLTGDNQRIKNQQAVFEALIEKATSSKTMAISYGKILTELQDYFEMSFSSSEIRSLMKYQIATGPDWKIYKNTVTGPGANKVTYSGGSQKLYVMEQDPTSVANAKALINAVLEGKELQEDEAGNVTVVATEE